MTYHPFNFLAQKHLKYSIFETLTLIEQKVSTFSKSKSILSISFLDGLLPWSF